MTKTGFCKALRSAKLDTSHAITNSCEHAYNMKREFFLKKMPKAYATVPITVNHSNCDYVYWEVRFASCRINHEVNVFSFVLWKLNFSNCVMKFLWESKNKR